MAENAMPQLKVRSAGVELASASDGLWSVDQFPPTLLHSTILTSDPCQGDGMVWVKDFIHSVLAGADWQGSRRLLECGLCRERHRGRL